MKESMKVTGHINLKAFDSEGNLKDERDVKNVITTASLAEISGLVGATGSKTAFTFLATGTGTTAASSADTQLETEVLGSGLERAAATVSQQTTTETNDTLQLLKSFSVTGTVAVTEAGAGNNAAADTGTLFGHQVFAAVNVVSGDTLQITYKFAFS